MIASAMAQHGPSFSHKGPIPYRFTALDIDALRQAEIDDRTGTEWPEDATSSDRELLDIRPWRDPPAIS